MRYFSILFFLTFVLSCTNKREKLGDRILYKAPKDSSISYEENLANLLSLNSVKSSTNDFDFRVWFWGYDNNFVLSVAGKNNDTLASVKQFSFAKEDSTTDYIQVLKFVKNATPLSGWSAFRDSINTITSDTLFISDSREKIKGFTGGIFLVFQFQQNGDYKEAKIFSPAYMQEREPRSREFLHFIRFLEKQFQTKMYFEK